MQPLEGDSQAFAFMPTTGEAAVLGASSLVADADLVVSAVSASTGAVRKLVAINGSRFLGSLPGQASYSPQSNHFYVNLRNVSNERIPAAFFVDMATGDVVTRAGCWTLGLSYNSKDDTFVGLDVLGATNATHATIASIPADGSADCAVITALEGAAPTPYMLVGSVQGFDPESSRLFVYAELNPAYRGREAQPSLSLLSISTVDGSLVAYDASLTPRPSALVVAVPAPRPSALVVA